MKLNLSLSKSVFEDFKDIIRIKQCYDNIYSIVNNWYNMPYKIGFVYVSLGIDLQQGIELNKGYTRHAVLLDEDNSVIDPTLYGANYLKVSPERLKSLVENKDSYILIESLAVEDYLNVIEETLRQNGVVYTSLDNSFEKRENEVKKQMMKMKKVVI